MKNETIVDRVVGRLKTQPLGDLITEEDLHDIVKQAIPMAFMQERRIPATGYGGRDEIKPALIVEMAQEALKASVREAVDKWMADHAEELAAQWRPIFDKGVEQWLSNYRKLALDLHIGNVLRGAFQDWNNERQRQGLPTIMF